MAVRDLRIAFSAVLRFSCQGAAEFVLGPDTSDIFVRMADESSLTANRFLTDGSVALLLGQTAGMQRNLWTSHFSVLSPSHGW